MNLNEASHTDEMQRKVGKPIPPMTAPERANGRRRRGWKGFYGSLHDIVSCFSAANFLSEKSDPLPAQQYSYPCEVRAPGISETHLELSLSGWLIGWIHRSRQRCFGLSSCTRTICVRLYRCEYCGRAKIPRHLGKTSTSSLMSLKMTFIKGYILDISVSWKRRSTSSRRQRLIQTARLFTLGKVFPVLRYTDPHPLH